MLRITDNIVAGKVEPISEQVSLIKRLTERREKALSCKNDSLVSIMRTVDFLLNDCMKLGTLPFSIMARYAFIATSFLKSLKTRGIMSSEEIDKLTQSIPSIATKISNDFFKLKTGDIKREEFLMEYGHLRPGTYDITSQSYAEAPEFYLSNLSDVDSTHMDKDSIEEAKTLFDSKSSSINNLIQETGFTFSATQFRDFIFASIPERENLKFEFTKNLSAALSLIAKYGECIGLSRDDMSFLQIIDLLKVVTNSPSHVIKKELIYTINHNRKRFSLHNAIKLPHMIHHANDIYCFELLEWQPNYITSKRVEAPIVNLKDIDATKDSLSGKIAVIESADPGYDWILSRGICGLVTKYGGTASHMAIRAAELNLPSAIGCGEIIFKKISSAQVIEIDCSGQYMRILK